MISFLPAVAAEVITNPKGISPKSTTSPAGGDAVRMDLAHEADHCNHAGKYSVLS